MSSHVGNGEYRKDQIIEEKDFYARKRGLVPTAPEKALFEEKKTQPINTEMTPLEIEKLETYACKLLLVG